MNTVTTLWIILLVVTVLVLPIIVAYLHKVYKYSKSIDRYFKEMLKAGLGIAGNTEKIPAMDDTLTVASGILKVTYNINKHTEALGDTLASRVESQ